MVISYDITVLVVARIRVYLSIGVAFEMAMWSNTIEIHHESSS
jgi:hypothetical protein